MTTFHPAYVGYEPAKSARAFFHHVEKAVKAALGEPEDGPPEILYNPSAAEAEKVFRSWKDGFACDIETPSLTDHRILSIAVSGDWDLAMAWDLRVPGRKRGMGPLKRYLANGVRKVFQNGDFDIPILDRHGYPVRKESCWDTMLESQMLNPDEPVNLSFLTSMACDVEAWKHLRGPDLLFYNALDACYDWRVYVATQDQYEEFEQ
jgi:hypothetical protein